MAIITKKEGKIVIGNITITPVFEEELYNIIYKEQKTSMSIEASVCSTKVTVSIFDTEKQKWVGGLRKDIKFIV